ncbi:MAG: Hsp20 family protein [Candidatus Sulfotelmatobacter sp.]
MKPQKAESKVSPAIRIKLAAPDTVQREMQRIGRAIAERAHELFAARYGEHGHDWEDWFQAESELLRPVSIALSESPNHISIRVNIDGFSVNEVKVGIEAKNVTIVAKKDERISRSGEGRNSIPNQILRSIALTSEIDVAAATIELESGVLKLELPKVTAIGAKAAGAGTV